MRDPETQQVPARPQLCLSLKLLRVEGQGAKLWCQVLLEASPQILWVGAQRLVQPHRWAWGVAPVSLLEGLVFACESSCCLDLSPFWKWLGSEAGVHRESVLGGLSSI